MAPTLNLKSWEEGSSGEAESKGSLGSYLMPYLMAWLSVLHWTSVSQVEGIRA